MKYKNVIAFEQTTELIGYNPTVQSNLNNWASSIGVNIMTQDGYSLAPVSLPPKFQIGTFYYYWLKMNAIAHRYGFDLLNHYIELPLTWLDEVYETKTVDIIDDETGEAIESTEDILNKDHYRIYTNKSDDNCLVRVLDKDWNELKELISLSFSDVYKLDNYPDNVLDNEAFKKATSIGGDYYKVVEEEVIE